jgi:membrane fusion protein (multidrug efflux system)
MKNRNKGIIAGTAVIALALIIFAPKIFNSKAKQEGPASSRDINAPVNVKISKIVPRTIENKIYSSGTILGNEEVDLRSETSGKITQILFTEGARV